MPRIIGTILLLIFPWLIFSQQKTPFVSYDFENDSNYKNKLKLLKNHPNREYEGIIKSIAELSYNYKDWETAIDHYEKLLVNSPKAENYFKLGVAAARKSLEVPRFFSVPYVVKARKSVLQAHELAPNRVVFFNLLIQLHAEIPSLLGGSIDFAEKKANELRDIDPVEGGMMQAYIFQVRNDFKASASKYSEVFQSLKEIFPDPENCVSELRRDLIFDLGRVSAQYQMESNLGLLFLDHYLKSYGFQDNYPLEWAYYYRSKIYLYMKEYEKAEASIQKALEINSDFDEGLEFLKNLRLE